MRELRHYQEKFNDLEAFKEYAQQFNVIMEECCSTSQIVALSKCQYVPYWLGTLTKCCMKENEGIFYERPSVFYKVCNCFGRPWGNAIL